MNTSDTEFELRRNQQLRQSLIHFQFICTKSEVSDGSSAKAHSGPAKEETTKPHALHTGAD
ncbi:hypothetical protein BS50DRAFT_579612 [Corynespora cassiicola Philippines]|uniref:Uncharacterized protein n=1 Tax=Corynespora cassiicola Philippines TaxID=1448308 RepID=A0A2T2N3Z2_CORCC|nr:hypothetical protein BS50DRAFT_579612 [Corynespora cassiicola Philippines]